MTRILFFILIYMSSIAHDINAQERLDYKGELFIESWHAGAEIEPQPNHSNTVFMSNTLIVVDENGRFNIDSTDWVLLGFAITYEIAIVDTTIRLSDTLSKAIKIDSIGDRQVALFYWKNLKTGEISNDWYERGAKNYASWHLILKKISNKIIEYAFYSDYHFEKKNETGIIPKPILKGVITSKTKKFNDLERVSKRNVIWHDLIY